MKKIIMIIIAVTLVLSITACGDGGETPTQPSEPITQHETPVSPAPATQPVTPESPVSPPETPVDSQQEPESAPEPEPEPESEPEPVFQVLRMNDTITTDFAELTLVGAEISEEVTVQTQDGYPSTLYGSNIPDSKVVSLIFRIKNLHTDPIAMNYMQLFTGKASVGRYNFGVEHLSGANGNLNPLTSAFSVVFAQIPDELIDSGEQFIFNIGFLENFEVVRTTDLEDCPYRYSVTLVRADDGSLTVGGVVMDTTGEQESNQEQEVVMTGVSVGDTISLGFVEITIDEVGIEDNIQISIRTGGGSITVTNTTGPQPEAGNKFVYIRGTIKNLTTTALFPNRGIFGNVTLDGYTYPISRGQTNISIINGEGRSQSSIEPLMTYTYTLYAAVPESLADSFSEGALVFVFDDLFDSSVLLQEYSFGDPIAAATHKYVLLLK